MATARVEVRRRAAIVDEIAEVAPVVVDGTERFGYSVSKGGKVPLICVSDRRSVAPADHAVSTFSCRGQLCCCCRSLGHLIQRQVRSSTCMRGRWQKEKERIWSADRARPEPYCVELTSIALLHQRFRRSASFWSTLGEEFYRVDKWSSLQS